MCGIFGYLDRRGRTLAPAALAAMGLALRHRGPDDAGVFADGAMAIGNQRLSIIDIAGGHQPFLSDDGRIALVQNGEIFNHVELAEELGRGSHPCRTHSDTEVLLRLYERDGIDFVKRLNGMFAIAIWDGRTGDLFLIRDRVGVKPLFVHDDGDRMLFASEIKSMIAAGAPRRRDDQALDQFLALNYVPPPRTMFADIRHVMPGHWERFGRDGHERRRWWDLAAVGTEPIGDDEWCRRFLDILDDAVRLRLRADVPFGAFLSGGVDSSTIVGLMARHLPRPVETFCIGFHDPRYDEAAFAQAAADRFGTRHVMERVDTAMLDRWPEATWFCDQPHGDVSFLPTWRVSELAARHVKMVLTGDGGDELFAGYDKHRDFFATAESAAPEAVFRDALYRALGLFTDADRHRIYAHGHASSVDGAGARTLIDGLLDRSAGMDRINQALFLDTTLLLPGNNLVKPDRMGMAVSIEARTPFLDYRMVEFAFRTPGDRKLRDGQTKWLYKQAVEPLIGKELAHRRKQMFTVPVGEWLKRDLAAMCDSLLLGERASGRALFDRERVDTLLREHRTGTANRTREIRALLAVEIWHRIFIDGDGSRPPSLSELAAR